MEHLPCKEICLHSNQYYGCYSFFPKDSQDSGWQLKGYDQASFLMLINTPDNYSNKFLSISWKGACHQELTWRQHCLLFPVGLQSVNSEPQSAHTERPAVRDTSHSSAKQGFKKAFFHLQPPQMRAPELSLAPDRLSSRSHHHSTKVHFDLVLSSPRAKPEPHAGSGLASSCLHHTFNVSFDFSWSPLDLWLLLLSDTQNTNYTSFSRQWGSQ